MGLMHVSVGDETGVNSLVVGRRLWDPPRPLLERVEPLRSMDERGRLMEAMGV